MPEGWVRDAWNTVTNWVDQHIVQPVKTVINNVVKMATGQKQWSWKGLFETNATQSVSLTYSSSSSSSYEEVKNIPTIRGAKNQTGAGRPYPLVLGKHRFSPFYAGNPYTFISGEDGEDQYYVALYNLGYSQIKATKFQFGELDLASNSGDVRNGFIPVDGSLFLENDAKLEISQTGVCSLYPQKVVEEQINIALLNVEGSSLKPVRFTAPNPMKVQVEITINGLLTYDDEGNKQNAGVNLLLEWREGEGYEWKNFITLNGTTFSNYFSGSYVYVTPQSPTVFMSRIVRQKAKAMRFVAERTFTYEEIMNVPGRVLELRIQRMNPQPTDGRTTDTVVLSAIRTWIFDYKLSQATGNTLVPQLPMIDKDRQNVCLCALQIKATDDLSGTIDAFNCMVESCARTWNSQTETWSSAKTPTNNPAALMLNVMQSPTLKTHAYPDSKIDLLRLGELYEFCETNNFSCNGVLTSQKKLSEVIDLILSTCRSAKILNGTKWSVVIDKPRDLPVTILNNHNIISASNQKTFDELPDGYCIRFLNQNNDYQEDEIYCMYVNGRELLPDAVIENIEMPFVTDPLQVWKNGKFELAKRKLRPEVWNRTLSIDGELLSIGCLVTIQDDTIVVGIGDGAEITAVKIESNYITEVSFDTWFEVPDTEEEYGLKIIQADGIHTPRVRTVKVNIPEAGRYTKFTLTTPISTGEEVVPHIGDICSFGIYDKITIDALCFGITPQNGAFDCVFIPYDANVYTADQGEIPEFDSKVTPPKGLAEPQRPPVENVTMQQLIEQIENLANGKEESPAIVDPDAPAGLTAVAEENGIRITVLHTGTGMSNQIRTYTVEVQKGYDQPWVAVTSKTNEAYYTFNRSTDGYPEATDLNAWNVRAKVTSIYNRNSEYCEVENVDTDSYGTWLLETPLTNVVVMERTAILSVARQPTASGRAQYGNTKFAIQIQRLQSVDDLERDWFEPATSLNPYPTVIDGVEYNNVNNYRNGESRAWLDIGNTFSQQLPLYGQAVTKSASVNTFYRYKIKCYNVVNESASTIVGFTVLCTNMQDIVKSREDFKELYVGMLSAICQNVGLIKQGAFGDLSGQNNHWALSNMVADPASGIPHDVYEGDFRVGGRNEYIKVIPVVQNGMVKDYRVEFKTSMFTVSTDASEFNGNVIVQKNNESLDRTKITPQGTYYQHRNTSDSDDWKTVAFSHTNGFMSSQFFSEKTVFFTNQTMEKRRLAGYDIGAAMPSDDALIYHFDTDYLNQHQTNGLVITDAEDGTHTLAGEEDSSDDIDFTPAILAVAPYSTVGKSLYGQCSVSGNFGNTTEEFSVDFWEQYIYAENQVLFEIGTANEKARCVIANTECYLFGIFEDENIPMFEEMRMTRLYTQLGYSYTSRMFMEGTIMFAADTGECDMFNNIEPEYPYDETARYYFLEIDEDEVEHYVHEEITEEEYLERLPDGIYVHTCEMNAPADPYQEIQHVVNGSVVETVTFAELGLEFEPNTWVHFGIFGDSNDLRVCIDYVSQEFDRQETSGQLSILLNQNKTSVIIDELLIDNTTAATLEDFTDRTEKRIPFGSMDESQNWFFLLADNPANIKTNIFEAPQFKTAVEAVLREHELI